jgi:hypothetical protein
MSATKKFTGPSTEEQKQEIARKIKEIEEKDQQKIETQNLRDIRKIKFNQLVDSKKLSPETINNLETQIPDSVCGC